MTQGERKVIRHVLGKLQQRGWMVHSVSDGEDRISAVSVDAALAVVDSVEESWIYMTPPDGGKRHTIYVVLGNDSSGEEVIADCSEHADIEWATA